MSIGFLILLAVFAAGVGYKLRRSIKILLIAGVAAVVLYWLTEAVALWALANLCFWGAIIARVLDYRRRRVEVDQRVRLRVQQEGLDPDKNYQRYYELRAEEERRFDEAPTVFPPSASHGTFRLTKNTDDPNNKNDSPKSSH